MTPDYGDITGVTLLGASGSLTADFNTSSLRSYSYKNLPSGVTGVRVTTTSSHTDEIVVVFEGTGQLDFDVGAVMPGDFTDVVSVTVTTTAADDLFVARWVAGADTFTPDSGYAASTVVSAFVAEYNSSALGAAGSETISGTFSASDSRSGYAVAYKAAAGSGYTLTASAGSYALTGNAANTLYARIMTASAGSYALTGVDALLVKSGSYSFNAEPGSYTLVGSNALVDLSMNAEVGSYALTGRDATLTYSPLNNRTLTADFGSYALTGQAANTLFNRALVASPGAYTLTGRQAGLIWSGAPTATGYASQKLTFSTLTISL